jgi:hypothetical protein
MANKRDKIEASLHEQLAAKGADIELFDDMISDYMRLWDLKEKLVSDIEAYGLTKCYKTATGTGAEKDNPSVKILPNVNKQMLMLLKQLGIKTDGVVKEGASDDDL